MKVSTEQERLNNIKNNFSNIPNRTSSIIKAEFFSNNKNSNAYKLLQPDGIEPGMKLKGESLSYNLKKPCFISQIQVIGDSSIPKVKIAFKDLSGKDIEITESFEDSEEFIKYGDCNHFAKNISISLEKGFRKKSKIKRVKIFGYHLDHIPELEESLSKIESEKKDLEELLSTSDEKIRENNEEISQLNQEKQTLSDDCDRLNEQKDELDEAVRSFGEEREKEEQLIRDYREEKKKIEETKNKLTTENKQLEKVIKHREGRAFDLENDLKSLEDNISLYTEDVDGINKHSKSISSSYWWYIGILSFVAIAITSFSVYTAFNLFSSYYESPEKYKLLEMISLRALFILIVIAFDVGVYKLCSTLFKEILQMNRKRIKVTEIGKLARDTAKHLTTGYPEKDKNEIIRDIKNNFIKDYMVERQGSFGNIGSKEVISVLPAKRKTKSNNSATHDNSQGNKTI